jgi:hypothetical protein
VTSFGSGAVKVLAIGNGTQGGALSDAVQIASKDLSSGNTMVSIRLEGTAAKKSTGLLALSSFDRAFAVEVNGETIWLIAASVEPT